MNLSEIRSKIDAIDDDMLSLFVQRMELCMQVADYKKNNSLPIVQGGREDQIIERVKAQSPEEFSQASALLFTNIMDISKCLQAERNSNAELIYGVPKQFLPQEAQVIACQGATGSYNEEACKKLFSVNKSIRFFENFKDVVGIVESGRADFGILPLENSTVGSIAETYELMASHDFYITNIIRVEITHCLAAVKGADIEGIKRVFSKQEALDQCSEFLRRMGFEQLPFANTALAAKMVREKGDKSIACICSKHCAEINGLEILEEKAADTYPNYTKFICFSNRFYAPADAHTISVMFSVPHTAGGLYRILTKFAVNGLNLKRIVNKAVKGTDFEAFMILDFDGRYSDKKVAAFLDDMKNSLGYFKFLGNFSETN